MKKAKIMLSAIAVLGLVGGALAFNANKGIAIFTGTAANSCPTPTVGTTGSGAAVFYTFDQNQTTNCQPGLFTSQE